MSQRRTISNSDAPHLGHVVSYLSNVCSLSPSLSFPATFCRYTIWHNWVDSTALPAGKPLLVAARSVIEDLWRSWLGVGARNLEVVSTHGA